MVKAYMEIIRYLKATGLYYSDMVNNKERAEKARELMVTMFLDEEVQTALMEVTKDRSFMSFAKYMKVQIGRAHV